MLGPTHMQIARMWSNIARRTTRRGMPWWERALHALGRHPRFFLGRRSTRYCIDCGRTIR